MKNSIWIIIGLTFTVTLNSYPDELYPTANTMQKMTEFEGYAKCAHWDNKGVSIGYGSQKLLNGKKVPLKTKKGKPFCINQKQAMELFYNSVFEKSVQLDTWIKENKVKLTQNQYDALISFIYNVGHGTFLNSTVASEIVKKHYKAAAHRLKWYNKSNGIILNGLVLRREWENKLFLTKEKDVKNARKIYTK
jgi:lysozyme